MALAVALYFLVVGVLGVVASRRSSTSPEEYFLAGRGLRTVVLFMALFGTNCTSFVLVGIPGVAYRMGLGVFGLNAATVALGVPLTFWLIGSPARRMARRLGALTPAELYARRLLSPAVGLTLFLFFTAYTIPYMVQGVKGAALVVSQASDGRVEPWLAGLAVLAIVLLYTSLGGMRGTAWTNVFQGALFMAFMVLAIVLVARSLGGVGPAMRSAREAAPDILVVDRTKGLFQPRQWASWGLVISTTVIAFPHMFARLMAADSDAAMRQVCRLYPLALVVLWVPAVLIGVWGRGAFPDLGAGESDGIFQLMAATHLPEALGTLAFLAVLAAVMSTLDAQILTLSSMLVRDALEPLRGALTPRGEVLSGRVFIFLIAALVYVLSLLWGDSVFDISRKAFEGYTTLVPTLFLALRWRRFTAAGALVSILLGNAVLAAGWALGEAFPAFGFLPVFWAFVAASAGGVLVSLWTTPPPAAAIARAFDGVGAGAAPAQSSSSRK
jgi:SSS family solute:Na+ symporter